MRRHQHAASSLFDHSDQLKRCSSTGSSFKFYTLESSQTDAVCSENTGLNNHSSLTHAQTPEQTARNVNALCADRYYSEVEFERSRRKRWMRLLITAENAFSQIKSVTTTGVELFGCKEKKTARQAAQLIFPKIIVPLQKYLYITRLQHLNPPDSILSRLTLFLANNCSSVAFLSLYNMNSLSPASVCSTFPSPISKKPECGGEGSTQLRSVRLNSGANKHSTSNSHDNIAQSWSLVSEIRPASRPLQSESHFKLMRAGVILMCTVFPEPLIRIAPIADNKCIYSPFSRDACHSHFQFSGHTS